MESGRETVSPHSPGPWKWDVDKRRPWSTPVLLDANGREVVGASGEGVQQDVDVGDDDARLIAAAPELLAMLKRVLALADTLHDAIEFAPSSDRTGYLDAKDDAEALVRRIEGA